LCDSDVTYICWQEMWDLWFSWQRWWCWYSRFLWNTGINLPVNMMLKPRKPTSITH